MKAKIAKICWFTVRSRDVMQLRFPDTVKKKLVDLIGGCNFDFG